MRIGSIGYNQKHDADFVMDCTQGPGCYLFLHIRTPAVFEIYGESYKVRKGSVIILSPLTPCRYQGNECNYIDDWIYFGMLPEEKLKFEQDGIVFDKPLFISNSEDIGAIIRKVAYEHYSSEMYHYEIEEMFFSMLFMKLARSLKANFQHQPGHPGEKDAAMLELRTKIYSDPVSFNNVSEIARNMNMSCSGLQHSYKKLFDSTISQDIISSRIIKAKELLLNTNLTVDKIAESCGYSCTYSFLRQFRSKCQLTPTQFRNKSLPDGEMWKKLKEEDDDA